jgi:glycosyltransferase involved in cell wall biosynthesis
VLDQEPQPNEIFVCDDASGDGTRARFESWASEEPRLRYHRFDPACGGPGPGRNHAIKHATGDWIAFLDDDDEWLPGKLAAQLQHLVADEYDVIGTNALRSSGPLYFPDLTAPRVPSRRELLHVNPLVISSVVARRSLLRAIGGFADLPWLRGGPLDYHTWLRLSDAGARFLVLPEPLVRYHDPQGGRLSSSPIRIQRALVRMAWSRWIQRRSDRLRLEAALRHTADAGVLATSIVYRRLGRNRATNRDRG